MNPKPILEKSDYKGCGKLKGKTAFTTGGDGSIGVAAIAFAKEGAGVVIFCYASEDDANEIVRRIREIGQKAMALQGDVGEETFAEKSGRQIIDTYGKIDILVNNAGEQHVCKNITTGNWTGHS